MVAALCRGKLASALANDDRDARDKWQDFGVRKNERSITNNRKQDGLSLRPAMGRRVT